MKTKLIIFGLLCFKLSFGQQIPNQSITGVQNFINPVPVSNPPTSAPNEIFRFAPGNITQLDNFPLGTTTNFDFTNSRWFSLGRVTTGANTAYGLRFQLPNKALTFGYQSINDLNPRIQWIGKGASLGNLEFRVADSFTSTVSTLVATMTKDGNTIFGNPADFNGTFNADARVTVLNGENVGLVIDNANTSAPLTLERKGFVVNQSLGFNQNTGGEINVENSNFGCLNKGLNVFTTTGSNGTAIGIESFAGGDTFTSIGVKGGVDGLSTFFGAGINGEAPILANQWAGYFNGRIFASSITRPSDRRLKFEVSPEPLTKNLERLMQLKPVTYKFKDIKELNLPRTLQHGFIAQDIEKVFPELVTEISKPTFDEKGKVTGSFTFKAIEYEGITSMLLAGIQELNEKVTKLESQLADRNEKSSLKTANVLIENTKAAFMEQNIPNPFSDQATIRYQLPESTTTAEIMVFDLNGRLIKNYPVNNNQTEITIKTSEIGSGLFIYSLVQNGQELLSKKMIVK